MAESSSVSWQRWELGFLNARNNGGAKTQEAGNMEGTRRVWIYWSMLRRAVEVVQQCGYWTPECHVTLIRTQRFVLWVTGLSHIYSHTMRATFTCTMLPLVTLGSEAVS